MIIVGILTVFLLLVVLFLKGICRIPVAGLLLGYMVWFYDYDFLLNMGGPSTPISDHICLRLGLKMCCCGEVEMLAPLFVLVLAGGFIGLLLSIPCGLARGTH